MVTNSNHLVTKGECILHRQTRQACYSSSLDSDASTGSRNCMNASTLWSWGKDFLFPARTTLATVLNCK